MWFNSNFLSSMGLYHPLNGVSNLKYKLLYFLIPNKNNFKIGDKVLISNDFYIGKNPKLAPMFTGPGKIIDINDTNARVKINNKIKILNVNKLKLFLQNIESDESPAFLDYDFNENSSDKLLTRARAKLIKYKEAAQLALTLLKNEEEEENIDAMCDILFDQCPICDTEERYLKDNPRDKKIN